MLAINVYDVKPQMACVTKYDFGMKNPGNIRDVVSANLKALMDSTPDLNTQMKIAEKTKGRVSQRTVGRILDRSVSVTVDHIAELAAIFHLQPWQLLLPGLDPKNPQIVPAITAAEKELYDSIKSAVITFQSENP